MNLLCASRKNPSDFFVGKLRRVEQNVDLFCLIMYCIAVNEEIWKYKCGEHSSSRPSKDPEAILRCPRHERQHHANDPQSDGDRDKVSAGGAALFPT